MHQLISNISVTISKYWLCINISLLENLYQKLNIDNKYWIFNVKCGIGTALITILSLAVIITHLHKRIRNWNGWGLIQ